MDTQLQETIRAEEYIATGDRHDERATFENNSMPREVPISTEPVPQRCSGPKKPHNFGRAGKASRPNSLTSLAIPWNRQINWLRTSHND